MPRKKSDPIKAFSPDLNNIVHLKRLTERQYKIVFNKLVKLVKSVKSGEFSFISYVKTVISSVLTLDEIKNFTKLMASIQEAKKDGLEDFDVLA